MTPEWRSNHAQLAQRLASGNWTARLASVTSYDQDNYAAKVTLQPTGEETGWIPVSSPWVGDQWGLFCPPSPGDQVSVIFDGGDRLVGLLNLRFFHDEARPLPVPSGEFWLVHKSQSLLKFTNDGDVLVASNRDLIETVGRNYVGSVAGDYTLTVAGAYSVTASGDGTLDAASWSVQGALTSTDDGTFNGVSVVNHPHSGVTAGSDDSGPPVSS